MKRKIDSITIHYIVGFIMLVSSIGYTAFQFTNYTLTGWKLVGIMSLLIFYVVLAFQQFSHAFITKSIWEIQIETDEKLQELRKNVERETEKFYRTTIDESNIAIIQKARDFIVGFKDLVEQQKELISKSSLLEYLDTQIENMDNELEAHKAIQQVREFL